jgi:DivIVA domain-containing protein
VLTFLAVLAVAAVLLVAAAVATHEGDVLVDSPPDDADVVLPDGPLQPEDIGQLRFGMVLRGYRMAEVDRVLSRFAQELAARDARIAELEGAPAVAAPPEPEPEPAPEPEPEFEPPSREPGPEFEPPAREPGPGFEPPVPAPSPFATQTSVVADDAAAVHAPVVGLVDLPTGPPAEPRQAAGGPAPLEPSGADLVPDDGAFSAAAAPASPYDESFDLFPEVQLPDAAPTGLQDAIEPLADTDDDRDTWSGAGAPSPPLGVPGEATAVPAEVDDDSGGGRTGHA